jgi:hypothetical protein
MDIIRLQNTIAEAGLRAGLDYWFVDSMDKYGSTMTSVNAAIAAEFGLYSKGIWCKVWHQGPNRGPDVSRRDKIIICHDLTQEQGEQVMDVLRTQYNVLPERYDPQRCIVLTPFSAADYTPNLAKDACVNGMYTREAIEVLERR